MALMNKRGVIVRLDIDELAKLLAPEDPDAKTIGAEYKPEIRAIDIHLVNTGHFIPRLGHSMIVSLETLREINAEVHKNLIVEKARVAAETTGTCRTAGGVV